MLSLGTDFILRCLTQEEKLAFFTAPETKVSVFAAASITALVPLVFTMFCVCLSCPYGPVENPKWPFWFKVSESHKNRRKGNFWIPKPPSHKIKSCIKPYQRKTNWFCWITRSADFVVNIHSSAGAGWHHHHCQCRFSGDLCWKMIVVGIFLLLLFSNTYLYYSFFNWGRVFFLSSQ